MNGSHAHDPLGLETHQQMLKSAPLNLLHTLAGSPEPVRSHGTLSASCLLYTSDAADE